MRWLALLTLAVSIPAAAEDLLVSGRFTNNILRFDAASGAFKSVYSTGSGLLNPNGIAFGPDNDLYAGLGDEGTVLRLDGQTGAFVSRFVSDTTNTFHGCRGVEFGPDGNLYVDDGPGDRVLRFDGRTGQPLGVAAQGGAMRGPVGLAIAADGTIYVGGALDNAVHVYRDGAHVRTCTGGTHGTITGVTLGPDGLLYAATAGLNTVLKYRPDTCEYLGIFAQGGNLLIYMTFDRDANLLVGSFSNNSVLKLDRTGASLPFISNAAGLNGTHDFAFVPEPPVSRKQQWIAGVGSVTGVDGLPFRSSLSLSNKGSAAATVTIAFTPRRGSTPTTTKQVQIAAGQSLFLADLMSELAVTAEAAGAIAIESDNPVVATARTYGVTSRIPVAQLIPSFGSDGLIGDRAATLTGLAEDTAFRTNFGAVNVSATPVELTITAFNTDGVQLGTTHYTIGAHQDTFAPRILSALGLSGRSKVQLRVTSSVAGAVYAWASIVDNASGYASFIAPVL